MIARVREATGEGEVGNEVSPVGGLDWERENIFVVPTTDFFENERIPPMGLSADDFRKYLRDDDDDERLGDALAALAVDVESDAVEDIRELRER